jgi:ribosome-binding factor A
MRSRDPTTAGGRRERRRSAGEPAGRGSAAGRGVSQRQRRVAEELRHLLAEILRDGGSRDPVLRDANITVTEVRVSPDLRNATVYVMPLAGANADDILAGLRRGAAFLRGLVARELAVRHVPNLVFEPDRTFDQADRISALLASPAVERDLHPVPPAESETDDDV